MSDHDHRLPKRYEDANLDAAAEHAARVEHCPVCSTHDHSNRAAFGFDRDGQPVPAWWFSCPRCGTAESQDHIHRWTEAGMAWVRDHAGHVGTIHPTKGTS